MAADGAGRKRYFPGMPADQRIRTCSAFGSERTQNATGASQRVWALMSRRAMSIATSPN